MWASAPTTTRATACECAGDFYKNSCIPPGGRSHPPLPAAPDFGRGRLTSVESPQTPCARRGCAGGSAFFGTFLPCRTAERVRHPPRPEKSSSSRQDLQRSAADTARSVRPLRLCQAAFRHQRDRERETAYGWAQDTPKVGCPRPGAVRADILQTAAGNLRVAPDGRGIWHCCLNRLQQPCVAAARRFAKQITASKVRWRHRTRREQVQFRGGLPFLFIKARNAAFSRRTGRKWIQNHGQAAFPVI